MIGEPSAELPAQPFERTCVLRDGGAAVHAAPGARVHIDVLGVDLQHRLRQELGATAIRVGGGVDEDVDVEHRLVERKWADLQPHAR